MKAYAIQVAMTEDPDNFHTGEFDTAEEVLEVVAKLLDLENTDDLIPPSEDSQEPILLKTPNGEIMYGRNPNIPLAS